MFINFPLVPLIFFHLLCKSSVLSDDLFLVWLHIVQMNYCFIHVYKNKLTSFHILILLKKKKTLTYNFFLKQEKQNNQNNMFFFLNKPVNISHFFNMSTVFRCKWKSLTSNIQNIQNCTNFMCLERKAPFPKQTNLPTMLINKHLKC